MRRQADIMVRYWTADVPLFRPGGRLDAVRFPSFDRRSHFGAESLRYLLLDEAHTVSLYHWL